MKFGEEWLRTWINPSISNKQLCKQLMNFGCEVEYVKKSKIDVSKIVIGQIISKQPYCLNQQLCLYIVSICNDRHVVILFKKKKYLSVGSQVPVFVSKLCINKNIKTFLKKNAFLNYLDGSFCSYHLLNLEKKNHEVIILSEELSVYSHLDSFLNLYRYIIKFFIPFNRIDLHSVWGLSREIAILNNMPLPQLKYSYSLKNKKLCHSSIELNITRTKNIQYMFCELYNVDCHAVLPFQMQERLRRSNILTSNVIVNIVNYVFIETGHWFHIFDRNHLHGKLSIRTIKNKKILKNFYKKKISLESGTVVLSDDQSILSFEDMEYLNRAFVNYNTKNLFLGSICFDSFFLQSRNISFPKITRKIEYSKYNMYPNIQKNVFRYIQGLIIDICGGISSSLNIYNSIKNNIINIVLKLTIKKLNKIAGMTFTKTDIISILNICHFSYFEQDNIFFITPPYWRTDIRIIEDIISEIIRIYGCENVQSNPPKEYVLSEATDKKKNISLSRIKLFLVDRGYFEIISYSFINSKIQKNFFSKSHFLKIQNPISKDMSEMRASLWIGLLNCISYNHKRQCESIRIFETGLCFSAYKKDYTKIIQKKYLSIAMSGIFGRRAWYLDNRPFDFYDLKGDIESILDICGKLDEVEFVSKKFLGLCSKQSVGIYLHNELIGKIGVLDNSFFKIFDLKHSVVLCEIVWKKICKRKHTSIKNISVFPSIKRDISIIISDTILSKDILEVCRNNVSNPNVNIDIYDIYTGSNIPIRKKSVSICLVFNSCIGTLRECDVNASIVKCIDELKSKFGAILRD